MKGLACALVLAVVTAGSVASAQDARREPTAGDLATARTALKEGLALREKGDVAGSVMRLTTAWEVVPTPVTGFELGKSQMMDGKVLQAHELFKKVLRMPPSMEESDRSRTAREESARLAKELEPRIPSLRIRIKLPAGASAVVRIDDDVVQTSGAETLRSVDPGSHEVFAKAGEGPEQHVRVEVAEGEVKDVDLSPQWIAPKIDAKKEKGQVVVVRQTTSPLTFIGFAGASAGLALTVSAAYVFVTATSDLDEKCGVRFCPATNESEIRRRDAWGLITLVGGLSTVGFLAAGIIGVSNPKKETVVVGGTAPSVRPTIGLGSLGLQGTF